MGTEKGDPAQTVNDQRFAKPRLDGGPANLPMQSSGVPWDGFVGQEVSSSEMLRLVTPAHTCSAVLGDNPNSNHPFCS